MADKKFTVYQNLNSFFNTSGIEGAQNTSNPSINNVPQEKIIIKGTSPEEIKLKALEIEQRREIRNKLFRTTDRGFQKALQYEAARLPAYLDYEGFEFVPLISSALDLYMEESTTIGVNGKMLNIYSNKERIKYHLEDFFYNIINVNVNLPFWTRNLVKYGDNFVYLYGERKKGITQAKQLVNYEIERYERIQDGKPIVKFRERMTGDEFNSFEVAHFRLLGDDKYLPYGSSVLNKVRRVTRQLIMAEDAMLTYRIIRAGEKKVFKIDVGNIDEDDIEDYIYKVATKFKKTSQVSPNDGQIDYRFNILGNDEDYFLPVRNANTQTGIETLPGASNLNDIHDIEYLRDNLFVGLGIPKPFLSFQDAAGAGKNMAQYDIRFAKKINRIQQAIIQELNKMAMIHLFYLGYTGEDLASFTLTLTNPSTQLELLKSELLREKAQTYTELTRGEGGIAAMSHTQAKRVIFNMSDREIVEDLKQQKMEKVIMQELQDSPVIIKKTGLFSDIDKRYGEPVEGMPIGGEAPPSVSGGSAQNSLGGGPENQLPKPIAGLPNQTPSELPPVEAEGYKYNKMKSVLGEEDYNKIVNKLVYGEKVNDNNDAISSTTLINEQMSKKAEEMTNEINELLNKSKSIMKNNEIIELQDIDIEDIE